MAPFRFKHLTILFAALVAVPLLRANPPSTHQMTPPQALESRESTLDGVSSFSVYRLNTKSLRNLGVQGSVSNIELVNALVQEIANVQGAGMLCSPAFINSTQAPCEKNEKLISFIRHSNSANLKPERGHCYCVPASYANDPAENKNMSPILGPQSGDFNFIDRYHQDYFKLTSADGTVAAWRTATLYAVNHSTQPVSATKFLFNDQKVIPYPKAEEPYKVEYNPDIHGEGYRARAAELWLASQTSPEWTDAKKNKPRNPYNVGIGDFEFKKEMMLQEYAQRSVDALGTDHSAFATFHNAQKLARITRDKNGITLGLINKKTREQLYKRFGDDKIVQRLMPKYQALNQYVWESVHAVAQADHPPNPSAAVDTQFQLALKGEAHREYWNKFADLEAAVTDIAYESKNGLPTNSTLASSRVINETELKNLAVKPSEQMCDRYVMQFTEKNKITSCPCTNTARKVPCNLNVASLQRGNFQSTGLRYGRGQTYQYVDKDDLPKGLRPVEFRSARTGYSYPNNTSPTGRSGSNAAGFAALNRQNGNKGNGIAHLGRGTLDDPITAAVSKKAAVNYGICQGDMIHDETYGWLRVEGGCTSPFAAPRVDVWRGNASTGSLSQVNFDPKNTDWKFTVFPAGLVDPEFASRNPGPKK